MDSANDGAHLSVTVRLDHCESSLALRFKVSSSINIAVVNDFQDSRQNRYLSANEEIIKLNRGNLLLLQEDTTILDIPHLD